MLRCPRFCQVDKIFISCQWSTFFRLLSYYLLGNIYIWLKNDFQINDQKGRASLEGPEDRVSKQHYSQALKPNGIFSAGFWTP